MGLSNKADVVKLTGGAALPSGYLKNLVCGHDRALNDTYAWDPTRIDHCLPVPVWVYMRMCINLGRTKASHSICCLHTRASKDAEQWIKC